MAGLLSTFACCPVTGRALSLESGQRRVFPTCFASCASSSRDRDRDRGRINEGEGEGEGEGAGQGLAAQLAALTAAAVLLGFSSSYPFPAFADTADSTSAFKQYFGTAASASSYGGYGGNASKRDTAEYVYDVPEGWKERQISKVEKGTNGTDSEFYNPRRKSEKVYVTYLSGFRRLAARDSVLGNLALSDVNLQDIIASADSVQAADRTDPASGQLYYDFEIDSPVAHSLISVTCAKNKLYAHFVNAPSSDWSKDAPMLRHIHQSFSTVGDAPLVEAAM